MLLGLRHYILPVVPGTPALLTQKIHYWTEAQRRHGIWLAAGNIVSTVHQHLHMDWQGRLNPFDLHNIPSCYVSSSCIDMSNIIESNPDHTHIQCGLLLVSVVPTFTGDWILQTLPTMTQAPRSKRSKSVIKRCERQIKIHACFFCILLPRTPFRLSKPLQALQRDITQTSMISQWCTLLGDFMIYSSPISPSKSASSNDSHDAGDHFSWAAKKGSSVCRGFSGSAVATKQFISCIHSETKCHESRYDSGYISSKCRATDLYSSICGWVTAGIGSTYNSVPSVLKSWSQADREVVQIWTCSCLCGDFGVSDHEFRILLTCRLHNGRSMVHLSYEHCFQPTQGFAILAGHLLSTARRFI